jgi:hypothetical protein
MSKTYALHNPAMVGNQVHGDAGPVPQLSTSKSWRVLSHVRCVADVEPAPQWRDSCLQS